MLASLGSVLKRVGTFLADVGYWTRTHRAWTVLLGALALVALGVTLTLVSERAPDTDPGPPVDRGPSFDPEAFNELQSGGSATRLEEKFGEPDYTEQGETAVAMSWVKGGVQYYVITSRERIVRSGSLPCGHRYARAC